MPSAGAVPAAAATGRKKRVAVVGAGVTGLAHADVLQRCGFEVVVFERADSPGGQWLQAYAEVDLQNTAPQYCFSTVPWPFKPHVHPTGEEILRYITHAVEAMKVDVRLRHEVVSVERLRPGPGWTVTVTDHNGSNGPTTSTDTYDFIVVCVGHFCNDQMVALSFPGADTFAGPILTERDVVADPRVIFEGKRVAVVGFGKAALDMTMLAARHGAVGPVHHVFRAARWMLPRRIAGISFAEFLFARFSTLLMPCWMHPTVLERLLHSRPLAPLVAGFWAALGWVLNACHRHDAATGGPANDKTTAAAAAAAVPANGAVANGAAKVDLHAHAGTNGHHSEGHANGHANGTAGAVAGAKPVSAAAEDKKQAAAAARRRLDLVLTQDTPLRHSLRAAVPVAPVGFCRAVYSGRIEPHRATISRLEPRGLVLSDGTRLDADVLVVCAGAGGSRYPFLPSDLRERLEGHEDGCQMYRHLVLPGEVTIGFGCMNHAFLLLPAAETGALWLAALWRGELELPPVSEMERAIDHVRNWKRTHMLFEPTRSEGITTRFQQYLDAMLLELGLSPYRKLPNVFAELFAKYGGGDYRTIVDEYLRAAAKRKAPLKPLPLMT